MKRIRYLGVAAVLALALSSAIGTASVTASALYTEKPATGASLYPAWMEGEATEYIKLNNSTLEARCQSPMLFAEASDPALTLRSSSGATLPCEFYAPFSGWVNATLELNGCELLLHTGAEAKAGEFGGAFEFGPAGCGPIRFNRKSCDLLIPAQSRELETGSGKGLINRENEGWVDTVEANVSTLMESSWESGGCGSSSSTSLNAEWELAATDMSGLNNPLNLTVRAPDFLLEGGLFKAKYPASETSKYPLLLSGAQSPTSKHVITLGTGRKIECGNVSFGARLAEASSQLAVDAQYSSCATKPVLGVTFQVSMRMNSCHYVFHAAGTMDVVCGKESDVIEAEMRNSSGAYVCTTKIAPQTGLASVGYNKVEVANHSAMEFALGLSVKSTGSGFPCGGGTPQTATYLGSTVMQS